MNDANFQWFSLAMDERTDVNNTLQYTVCISWNQHGAQYDWEISCLSANESNRYRCRFILKGQENAESLDVPTYEQAGLVTTGAPNMAKRNGCASPTVTDEMKNTSDRNLIIRHCLIHQENLCAKPLKMANVVQWLQNSLMPLDKSELIITYSKIS
jgi:hypothetical protein